MKGLSPFDEATVLRSLLMVSQTRTPCFTKEQENEAELLRTSPSSSELLPKDHHHVRGVGWDPPAPFWPFLFPPVVIPVTFPACTPLPGQVNLSIHGLPISSWGLSGPSRTVILLFPMPRRQPQLLQLLSPDTWCNRAGAYGALPGQTPSCILCCNSSLKYRDNSI